jgi:hypothetical protein
VGDRKINKKKTLLPEAKDRTPCPLKNEEELSWNKDL